MLDWRQRGRGFEPHGISLRCGPWTRHIYPSLVLVQPRKIHPCLTERLLMGRKESNKKKSFMEGLDDKHIVNFSPDKQHFILEQKEKRVFEMFEHLPFQMQSLK